MQVQLPAVKRVLLNKFLNTSKRVHVFVSGARYAVRLLSGRVQQKAMPLRLFSLSHPDIRTMHIIDKRSLTHVLLVPDFRVPPPKHGDPTTPHHRFHLNIIP